MKYLAALSCALVLAAGTLAAQQERPMSPRGQTAVQVGGAWDTTGQFPVYRNGHWVEVDYGRPIRRGRTNVFGSGAEYGQALLAGAPVWRAGANMSTRLKTEVPLVIGGTRVEAGEYSLFIDLKEGAWTLVVSSHAAKPTFQAEEGIWGSYDYDPAKDVARVAMSLSRPAVNVEQLTWFFGDVSDAGGKLVIAWDDVMASAEFRVAS